jgi:hypothetical protein
MCDIGNARSCPCGETCCDSCTDLPSRAQFPTEQQLNCSYQWGRDVLVMMDIAEAARRTLMIVFFCGDSDVELKRQIDDRTPIRVGDGGWASSWRVVGGCRRLVGGLSGVADHTSIAMRQMGRKSRFADSQIAKNRGHTHKSRLTMEGKAWAAGNSLKKRWENGPFWGPGSGRTMVIFHIERETEPVRERAEANKGRGQARMTRGRAGRAKASVGRGHRTVRRLERVRR